MGPVLRPNSDRPITTVRLSVTYEIFLPSHRGVPPRVGSKSIVRLWSCRSDRACDQSLRPTRNSSLSSILYRLTALVALTAHKGRINTSNPGATPVPLPVRPPTRSTAAKNFLTRKAPRIATARPSHRRHLRKSGLGDHRLRGGDVLCGRA